MQSIKRVCLAVVWLLFATQISRAIDYSVPYVRQGLAYTYPDYVNGYGAIVGQIEVRNNDGNGIDGFDGHRHLALGPNPGDPDYGLYGYIDVKDFSTGNPATGDPSDSQFHGTFVAGIMANNASINLGNGTSIPFSGVAPGAKYYGAIFDGADTKSSFLTLNDSLNYLTQTVGAQAINNSWGGSVTDASQLDGNSGISLLMDEYAGYRGKTGGTTGRYSDKLMVFAAGNDGQSTGLLGAPADSFNGLSVGALTTVNPAAMDLTDSGRMPAPQVASYSSWKPLANGRSGVDVVAPGSQLWSDLAINVASNFFGITNNANAIIAGAADGTSFAAPHVTGVAALLYGAPTQPLVLGLTYKGTVLSTDHKLIKAIIINSADKIPGLDSNGVAQTTWQPGWVVNDNGVQKALAPLNYAVGAGSVNAANAFLTYAEVSNRFWALSTLTTVGVADYYTLGAGKFTSADPNQPELIGVTATLVWDRHVDLTVNTDPNDPGIGTVDTNALSDLELDLQLETSPGVWTNIFISDGVPSSLQHIYMPQLPTSGVYRLSVVANSLADPSSGEQYALAVEFTMVPEPGAWLLVVAGFVVIRLQRGRARPHALASALAAASDRA